MTTKYMRSGSHRQYLHLAGCQRFGLLARLLRKVEPWPWANQQDRATLARLVSALDIKICRTCQPLGMRRPRRSPR